MVFVNMYLLHMEKIYQATYKEDLIFTKTKPSSSLYK